MGRVWMGARVRRWGVQVRKRAVIMRRFADRSISVLSKSTRRCLVRPSGGSWSGFDEARNERGASPQK